MTDAEQQDDWADWGQYTDRDEEVVATMLASDNFWRNFGFEHAGLSELMDVSHADAHNWP